MNKVTYFVIGAISLLTTAIVVTAYVQNNTKAPIKPQAVYTDFSVTLPSNNNNDSITIQNNFLKDVSVTEDEQNPGLYFLGNTFTNSQTAGLPLFVINYEKDTGFFNIALLQKPLGQSRLAAELYLEDLLQLNQNQLCAVSYMVTVPGYVDQPASGTDYRFSFCPGSVVLP